MRTTIRLPDELAADVRQRCQRLGISVNALVCVALDAWLRESTDLPAMDSPPLTPKEHYDRQQAQRKAARKRR